MKSSALLILMLFFISCKISQNDDGSINAVVEQTGQFENSTSGLLSESSEKSLEAFSLRDQPTMKDLVVGTIVTAINSSQAVVTIQTTGGDYDYRCISILDSSRSGTIIKKSVNCTPQI